MAVGLVIAGAGLAGADSPLPTPVTVTIKAKPDPQIYCDECIRFSGRIMSPKAVCRSERMLGNAVRYRAGTQSAGKTYRDDAFVATDGQGQWDIVVSSIEPLAWMEVTMPKERISGVVCKAARAKVTL